MKEKTNVIDKIMNFLHGVKVEWGRIHWTSLKDLLRYSIATFVFVVVLSLFFYAIDAIYALIQSLI